MLRIDAIEQYGRRDTFEIQGIPELPYDNPQQLVIEVARLADIEVEANDISIAHRLPSKKQGKIIVKFTRRAKRNEFYDARKKLRTKRSKDLPMVYAVPKSSTVSHRSRIYINESLTPYRKRLFNRILEFKRTHNYKYLWTNNGRIMLRESESSQPQCFVSYADFDKYPDQLSHYY